MKFRLINIAHRAIMLSAAARPSVDQGRSETMVSRGKRSSHEIPGGRFAAALLVRTSLGRLWRIQASILALSVFSMLSTAFVAWGEETRPLDKPNLAQNSGFEEQGKGWRILEGIMQVDSGTAHSGRYSFLGHFLPGVRYAEPETLDIAKILHNSRQMGISVVGDPRLAEIRDVDLSVRPARALYFYPVRKPRNANRSIRIFVSSVQDSVPGDLL